VKVKVNVDLYSASLWTHLYGAQVWHAFLSVPVCIIKWWCVKKCCLHMCWTDLMC